MCKSICRKGCKTNTGKRKRSRRKKERRDRRSTSRNKSRHRGTKRRTRRTKRTRRRMNRRSRSMRNRRSRVAGGRGGGKKEEKEGRGGRGRVDYRYPLEIKTLTVGRNFDSFSSPGDSRTKRVNQPSEDTPPKTVCDSPIANFDLPFIHGGSQPPDIRSCAQTSGPSNRFRCEHVTLAARRRASFEVHFQTGSGPLLTCSLNGVGSRDQLSMRGQGQLDGAV